MGSTETSDRGSVEECTCPWIGRSSPSRIMTACCCTIPVDQRCRRGVAGVWVLFVCSSEWQLLGVLFKLKWLFTEVAFSGFFGDYYFF